ncbi:MAG: major capsid protein [Clostridiales bacterium]|nr:major capsid protein [Clostridiales bacterium]
MPNYLGYPFDPELFNYNWENAKDPTLTAMIESGAVVDNAELRQLISNGSDFYTLPFYHVIGGEPSNYDGQTDIPSDYTEGGSQQGIVYGRSRGWIARDFTFDYNSGADPMQQITSQVVKYWQKHRQVRMLQIINAIFDIVGTGAFADWANHITDISSSTTTVTDANKVGETTIGDASQKAVGDAADQIRLVFAHSKVATRWANLQLLGFRRYTDSRGIERQLRIGDINGRVAIIDDGAPYIPATTTEAEKYVTYLLGIGAIQFAPASVKTPSEVERDAKTKGGIDTLYTRIRETIHPNGFSFAKPVGYTASPTNAQLANTANWSIIADPKTIPLAKIISNG